MASLRSTALASLLLGVILASPFVSADFDFYILELVWPGSSCPRPQKPFIEPKFLIRNFQTYNVTTAKPVTKCKKETIDHNIQIQDPMAREPADVISNFIGASYQQCTSVSEESYVKNEWDMWGVCSELDKADYFKTALDLTLDADTLSHLTEKGVVPDESQEYTISDITTAIDEGIGAAPIIRCNRRRSSPSAYQLYEVYICVDKPGKKFIDCPVELNFRCPSAVVFPPFTYTDFVGGGNDDTADMLMSVE